MSNFDLSSLALKAICPNNELLYDDKGMPSVMVKVPKATWAELGLGTSTATFPAFIVNNQEVNEIYVSKYINILQNGRAYSLPGQDPKANITFDQAIAACQAKGEGWHLMTALEWGALIRWCAKAGITPLGNNDYGKHGTESLYKAIPSWNDDPTKHTKRTATGTGPLTWFHDGTPSGIADLCGNVWEWTGGIRSVYGELQILVNNNAADHTHSQAAAGTEWKAINASTGELMTPNGSGTTSGSVKMDWVSSKLTYAATITDAARGEHGCQFTAITCGASIGTEAKNLLIALGMCPSGASDFTGNNYCYFNNNEAERSFYRGGNYGYANVGFASFSGGYPRSSSDSNIGFRSAYVKLPTA